MNLWHASSVLAAGEMRQRESTLGADALVAKASVFMGD
jgi:hypothetical protein